MDDTLAAYARRPRTLQILLALLVVGSLGPWAKVQVFGFAVSANGTSGDGWVTLVCAVVVAAAYYSPVWPDALAARRYVVVLVALGIGLLVAVADFLDISGSDFASVAWGLWVTMLSLAALVYVTRAQRPPVPDASGAQGPSTDDPSGAAPPPAPAPLEPAPPTAIAPEPEPESAPPGRPPSLFGEPGPPDPADTGTPAGDDPPAR